MPQIKIFFDSDVVISSLISELGAAHYLLNRAENLKLIISNYSEKELKIVCTRLDISQAKLNKLVKEKFEFIKIDKSIKEIQHQFKDYTIDPNDAHIVAGAEFSQAKFLITYNLKHFKVDKIKKDLKVNILTPANLLQYLRSLS